MSEERGEQERGNGDHGEERGEESLESEGDDCQGRERLCDGACGIECQKEWVEREGETESQGGQ